jgi:hypothetical protein
MRMSRMMIRIKVSSPPPMYMRFLLSCAFVCERVLGSRY